MPCISVTLPENHVFFYFLLVDSFGVLTFAYFAHSRQLGRFLSHRRFLTLQEAHAFGARPDRSIPIDLICVKFPVPRNLVYFLNQKRSEIKASVKIHTPYWRTARGVRWKCSRLFSELESRKHRIIPLLSAFAAWPEYIYKWFMEASRNPQNTFPRIYKWF